MKPASRKHALLLTLGCPKNEADSEVLGGLLQRLGYRITEEAEQADCIFINTCGFIEAAKSESIETILAAVELKKQDPHKEIIVWGCLSQRYGEDLKKGIPEVNHFFGVEPYAELGRFLSGGAYCWSGEEYQERVALGEKATAYLKIADGCNHHCTFCAIPDIKGRQRSRTPESLLPEAAALARRGVRELILTAQDTTSYGADLPGPLSLPELLHRLLDVEEFEWLRLLYLYPGRIDDRLLELIGSEVRICNYLDIPLQHISDPILKRMGRPQRQKEILSLLERLRRSLPGVVLRSTFIVGFPGETEAMFRELLDFMEEIRFDRAGAFIYSREEGTVAAGFAPAVPEKVARERLDRLMLLQQEISLGNNEKRIGQMDTILIEGYDQESGRSFGRSQGDAPEIDQLVWVEGRLPPGKFYQVRYDSCSPYDLVGRITNGDDKHRTLLHELAKTGGIPQ